MKQHHALEIEEGNVCAVYVCFTGRLDVKQQLDDIVAV